ncbi:copper resistance protein CopC/CopD [Streptomyces actuosus]|uniref:Copper resistance protein CopC/CopD n=1 Tax=Streptomyces actuosus TaxID=1885 RepID=A0ABS2VJG2_STRAS|nr:copper resistance protein CopC [Streptomyces actuosus]MBN0043226.1 copper resistance protein CopC/CopD [Streptomyces actuosus]
MTRTIAPRLRTLVLLLLAVAGALLAGAAPASAHAALTGSDPAQGAVVDRAPDQVNLTFSEKVALNDDSLRVLDPQGARVDKGDPAEVSGTTYAVQLRGGLPDGTYTVAFQVVSADSHPVSGAYTFSVGAPSATTVALGGQEAGGGLVGGLYGLGRYVSYAGFVVLVGGAAFVLACWPGGCGVRAVQRLVVAGWLALTAATLGLLLLRGSYTTSGKASDILDLDLLGQVLQTKTGAALVSRLLLLGAAALFIAVLFGAWEKREGAEKRDPALGLALGGSVVAVGIAASWAMSEHASTGLQPGVAMPVDVVHLLAVAAWLGGLTALLVGLYGAPAGTPVTASAVRRFSTIAFASVVALVATGAYQSWRQLGSWSALTGTGYGQLLLVKVGLVALLVGIASISRRWTARLTDTADAAATRRTPRAQPVTAPTDAASPARGGGEPASGSGGAGADGTGEQPGTAAQDAGRGTEAAGAGTEDPDAGAADGGAGAPGSARAAQLARQRAAVAAARRKRERDADSERFGLRRSVLAEAGVAVILLAVTTALTQTEPGRTEEAARAAAASGVSAGSAASATGALTLDMSFDTGGPDGKGVVSVDLDPARTGTNELHVYVTHPDGRAYDIPEVRIAFSLEAKDLGPLPVVPDHITAGHWSASGIQIPVAGDWKVAVTVRTSDIDQVTVSKNAQIG